MTDGSEKRNDWLNLELKSSHVIERGFEKNRKLLPNQDPK